MQVATAPPRGTGNGHRTANRSRAEQRSHDDGPDQPPHRCPGTHEAGLRLHRRQRVQDNRDPEPQVPTRFLGGRVIGVVCLHLKVLPVTGVDDR